MMSETKSKLGIFSLVLILILFVFARPAEADWLKDLWNKFLAPLGGKAPPAAAPGEEQNQTPPANFENPQPGRDIPLYQPVIDYEKAVIAAVKKASPAVVSITISKNVPILEECPYDPFADLPPEVRRFFGEESFPFYIPCDGGRTELKEIGGGSGFIISADGLILTNKHVVADTKASYTVFLNDGRKFEAKIVARDPVQDLAIIKIPVSGLSTVTLGDSDKLELGQTVIAIGNALGEFRNTVSVGVVSGLSRKVTASGGNFSETIYGVIQTDAAINPGNSGGPLLNLRGEVVGINTAVASGAENIGFAIPINDARRDIESVKSTGEIRLPFLGVRYVILTPQLAKSRNLPVNYGALVESDSSAPAVMPGSPAAAAGIKAGDIILEIDGQRVDADNPLATIISKHQVGEKVTLKVRRGNEILNLTAVLAQRPTEKD